MPTKRQLEVFLAVADAGSFRRAAERLDISQASVSKQIDALEGAVGGKVFERRRGSRAGLSSLGIALQRDARQILRLQRRWLGGSSPPESEDLHKIYIRGYLLENAVKPRLATLHSKGLPRNARFIVLEESDEVCLRIRKEPNSIGVLRMTGPPADPTIRSVAIRRDACSLYVSPKGARSTTRRNPRNSDLPIILPQRGMQASEDLRQRLLDAGFGEQQFHHRGQFFDLLVKDAVVGNAAVVLMDAHAKEFVARRELVRLCPVCYLDLVVLGHVEGRPDRFESLVNAFTAVLGRL